MKSIGSDVNKKIEPKNPLAYPPKVVLRYITEKYTYVPPLQQSLCLSS